MMVCAPILVECFIAVGTGVGKGKEKRQKGGHFFLRKQDTEESVTQRGKTIANIVAIRVNIFAFFLTYIFMVEGTA